MALPFRLINCLMIPIEYGFCVAKTVKKFRSSCLIWTSLQPSWRMETYEERREKWGNTGEFF